MSKEVKRYNFDVDKFGSPRAYESEHGRWMKRADYDALLAERDALKRNAERYRWLNNPANFHAAVSQQLWLLHGSQEFGERIDKAIGKGEQP